ncbi:MAG: hypothetical protein IJJ41_07355 [Clostridia bacterium]|nr:hypothetical protein [Clostridia bacterium]
MHFGFSYVGLIFLLMLYIPNLLWIKFKPQDYENFAARENRILLAFERIGEVAVTCLVLIFSDFNVQGWSAWLFWLAAAFVFMLLYEIFWLRYFKSERRMQDFYCSLLGIPVAGATLPVLATLLIAVYGKNIFLFAAGILLGIGHIGIHLQHKKEAEESTKPRS